MRISRVYFQGPLELNTPLVLPNDTSHYLNNVLRLRVDDKLLLFNAESGEYLAKISKAEKKEVEVELIEQQRNPSADTAINIHLLLGLSRGDRIDFAVQKSTELGSL